MGTTSPDTFPEERYKAVDENPFLDKVDFYMNPINTMEYDHTILKAPTHIKDDLEKMKATPSAYWIDVKAKIMGNGLNTVQGILSDAAMRITKQLVVFIWYDLPNRDCDAKASAGEICCSRFEDGSCNYEKESDCAEGIEEYKRGYVDPFVKVLQEYQEKVSVVLVIEPDSLPNLATNEADPRCGNPATQAAYKQGVKYSVEQLTTHAPEVVLYLDAAHGGWLGWEHSTVKFMNTIKNLDLPMSSIRGFATNVANYQPLGSQCPWCPDQGYRNGYCLNGKHQKDPCCKDPCHLLGQWSTGNNELNYGAQLAAAAAGILGIEAHVIIDTGRAGAAVDSCQIWCNPRGAGAGVPSSAKTANPDLVDAYFWLKTPGESDGCSATLPNGSQCLRFDTTCGDIRSLSSGEHRAPEAGHWYTHLVEQLAANANFEAPETNLEATCPGGGGIYVPSPPTSSTESTTGSPGIPAMTGCGKLFEQCGKVPYHETEFVIVEEGLSVGDHYHRFYSLDECKRLCDQTTGCNSFAYSQGACHLKDKCVSKLDALRVGNRFKTYFKSCDAGFRDAGVYACCEDGCTCAANGGYYDQCMPVNGTSCAAGATTSDKPTAAVNSRTTITSLAPAHLASQRSPAEGGGWLYHLPWMDSKPTGAPYPQTPKMILNIPSALPPPLVCAPAYELCHGAEAWHGASCCEPGCSCRPRGNNISECVPPEGRYMCSSRSRPSMAIILVGLKRGMGHLAGLVGISALGRVMNKAALPLAMVFAGLLAAGLMLRAMNAPRPGTPRLSNLMLSEVTEDTSVVLDSTALLGQTRELP
jgi:cellulose 1,4-beta-cellobiosidase